MSVGELIARLQELSDAGHGEVEVGVAISTNPERVASILRVRPPEPDADPEGCCEVEARSAAWIIAYRTDFDEMPYAPENLFS